MNRLIVDDHHLITQKLPTHPAQTLENVSILYSHPNSSVLTSTAFLLYTNQP